jgi:D-threo-aldose 1-dehydrogenase
MTSMPRRRMGASSLEVPLLGLGTAPLAGLYAPISEHQALGTVHTALNHGMCLFDTAPRYGAGLSEQRLGLALAHTPRDGYVLSTKVGWLIDDDGTARPAFTRDGVLRSITASLTRLRVDQFDIVHIHDPDEHYHEALNTVFPVLAELRAQRVIKAIGVGMNQTSMLTEFARHADFDCFLLAGRYTLLEQDALTELFPLCQERGIALLLGGVYNSGILATGAQPGAKYNYADAPPAMLERVRRIEAVCARYDVALRVAALHFPLGHPAVTALLIGAASPAEVIATVQALNQHVPTDLWIELRAQGLMSPQTPVPTAIHGVRQR